MTYPESVQRAGFADGDALFDAMLANPSGVTFTVDDYDETWARLDTPDGKVNLVIPELLEELRRLADRGSDAIDGVPVRAVRRRAPLVHRQHDLPRPRVAEEGRAAAPCG